MYHMMNGLNQATWFLIPMLGEKHPDEYPRFRDCFIDTGDDEPKYEEDIIVVYTRVGGGNRGCDYGEEELMEHPNFIETFDDDFDNTYGNYIFSVPEEFKEDYKKLKEGDLENLSELLQQRCRKVFPKLEEKLYDNLWGKK